MARGNGTALPSTRDEIAGPTANTPRSNAWRQLQPEDRLALIECALKVPANDFIDELPLAL